MDKKLNDVLVADFIEEFAQALREQLQKDYERWGDTWRRRSRDGQEQRAFARFEDYLDQFNNAGVPMPWLKITGEALIAWIREKYPEVILENEG